LKTAEWVGLRQPQTPQKVISPADLRALAKLGGFDPVKSERRILSPVRLFGLGRLINRFVCPLPLVRQFALRHYLIARSIEHLRDDLRTPRSLLICCSYLCGLRGYIIYLLVQITPLTLSFWAIAIIYPTLAFMGLGPFNFRGYYLHSLAPALTPVIGIALATVSRNWLTRTMVWVLLGYNVVFLFAATFMQFPHFAGCDDQFDVGSAIACWSDWKRLTENIDVLAYPRAALWLTAGGAIALGLAATVSLAQPNNKRLSI
jgi:hypothetical protein